MEERPKEGGQFKEPVTIEKMEGDIVMVSTVPAPPEIPAGKARICPQCGRRAWRLSRYCWHCGYDFGAGGRAMRWATLAALASFAAALINALIYCATSSR